MEDFTKDWYQRGKKVGAKVTKYRKGACTNCGAMTHTAKDCVERPRAKGAKYTGKDFKDDELVQELHLDFDGKRDQWNGYDPAMHAETIKRFNTIEKEREAVRKAKVTPARSQRSSVSSGCRFHTDGAVSQVEEDYAKGKMKVGEGAAEGDGDEMKEGENTQVVGAKHSTGHQRGSQGAKMSVRNLRIREDTAKYLINLDPGSAFYDPKTRSMRANPYAGTGKEGEPDRLLTTKVFSWARCSHQRLCCCRG